MIPRDKFRELMEGLLAKSKAGEVNWRMSDTHRIDRETEYLILLENFSLAMVYKKSVAIDSISVSIDDSQHRLIDQFVYEEGGEGWDLAVALFAQAESTVLGSDRVIDQFEKAIKSPGTIGIPAEQP